MSDNKNVYLQPTGLFAIDAAIGNVIRSMITGTPEATWKHIRILAYTTTDKDIIELSQRHSKETTSAISIMNARQDNISPSLNMTKVTDRDKYMDKRNEDLYMQVMAMLGKKGYIKKQSRDIASNTTSSQLFEQ